MMINNYIPCAPLLPYIREFKVIESTAEIVNRVIPDSSVAMAFRFRGEINYVIGSSVEILPVSAISGLRKSVRLINYKKNSAAIVVIFREGGAAAFFRQPIHTLFAETTSLKNFFPAGELDILESQLHEEQDNSTRIEIIENYLLKHLLRPEHDTLVFAALKHIHTACGIINVRALARQLFISHDAFEKRFRKSVGASPKKFSSIIRMRSVIKENFPKNRFIEMVYEGDYFDQSHFNKEFKTFTGQTPTDFFRSPSFW